MRKIIMCGIMGMLIFLNNVQITQGQWEGAPEEANLPSAEIEEIITNLMNWGLRIFSLVAILGFVISGFIYLTSVGDEERIKTAKKAMTWSIVGLLVGMSGVLMIEAIENFLGADNF